MKVALLLPAHAARDALPLPGRRDRPGRRADRARRRARRRSAPASGPTTRAATPSARRCRGTASPAAGSRAPGVRPWLPMADPAACNVADQEGDPDSVLEFCRRAIAARARPATTWPSGAYRSLPSPEGTWAFARGEGTTVLLNMSDAPAVVRRRARHGDRGHRARAWRGRASRATSALPPGAAPSWRGDRSRRTAGRQRPRWRRAGATSCARRRPRATRRRCWRWPAGWSARATTSCSSPRRTTATRWRRPAPRFVPFAQRVRRPRPHGGQPRARVVVQAGRAGGQGRPAADLHRARSRAVPRPARHPRRLRGRLHRRRHHVPRRAPPRARPARRPGRRWPASASCPTPRAAATPRPSGSPSSRGRAAAPGAQPRHELGHRARRAGRHPALRPPPAGRGRRAAASAATSSTCRPRWSTPTCRRRWPASSTRARTWRPRSASSGPSWRRPSSSFERAAVVGRARGRAAGRPRHPGHARQRGPGPAAPADDPGPGRRRRAGRGHDGWARPRAAAAGPARQRAPGALHPPRPAAPPRRRHGHQRRLRRRAAGAGQRRAARGGRRQRGQARGGGAGAVVGRRRQPAHRPAVGGHGRPRRAPRPDAGPRTGSGRGRCRPRSRPAIRSVRSARRWPSCARRATWRARPVAD